MGVYSGPNVGQLLPGVLRYDNNVECGGRKKEKTATVERRAPMTPRSPKGGSDTERKGLSVDRLRDSEAPR